MARKGNGQSGRNSRVHLTVYMHGKNDRVNGYTSCLIRVVRLALFRSMKTQLLSITIIAYGL